MNILDSIKSNSEQFENLSFLEICTKSHNVDADLKHKLIKILKQEKIKRFHSESKTNWETIARANQKLPKGNWFAWLIIAGRGFGKTRTGAESIKQLVSSGQYKRIALIGETFEEIKNVMVEGESGLLNLNYENERPVYERSNRKIVWKNGATATFYSAENPEQLRGPQFDLAWIDELAKFKKDQEIWDQLMFCLRLGKNPKIIITTTPRPKNLILNLINREDVYVTRGTTFENIENLSSNFIQIIESQYRNTKLGKQEVFGELIDKEDSQLWSINSFVYQEIDENLINRMNIIIAIDPAMTNNENSDETGIVVAGTTKNMFYILEDMSGSMSCHVWMEKIFCLYQKYKPDKIVVETNQGGEILMNLLKSFKNLPWKNVRAKTDKYARAIPISYLYEQKKVIHCKKFEKLEQQMIKAHLNFADDRLDALTWCLYELSSNYLDYSQNFRCL